MQGQRFFISIILHVGNPETEGTKPEVSEL